MSRLRNNDTVRLLRDCLGIHPVTDADVPLPGGAVGTVIESRDPTTVIVEFLTADGDVKAWASVAARSLMRT